MPRGNGGIIGPVNTSFSGVWSLTEAQLRRSANTWPNFYAALLSESATGSDAVTGADTADPYFEYTTLLLPGNGTNGAQNNTFLDGSTNNFTITRNGNTTQGTFSPFSQTGWGNYTAGSVSGASRIDVAGTSGLFGTNVSYTIEGWFNFITPSVTDNTNIIATNTNTYPSRWVIDANVTSSLINLRIITESNAILYSGSTVSYSLGSWVHLAIVNDNAANTLTFYINGQAAGTRAKVSLGSYATLNLLNQYGVASAVPFYASNFRITNGQALYSTNFTPSTVPLTTTSQGATAGNVALLTFQSNRFVDNSSSPKTLTVNGSNSIVAFSPFNPTASWSAATYGGSGYFDGSGDYLSVANNAAFDLSGSISWCIETWAYWNTVTGEQNIIEKFTPPGGPGWTLYKFSPSSSSGTLDIYGGSSSFNSAYTPVSGQWIHIVICRDNTSGRTSWFINGSRTATSTTFSISSNAATSLLIGARSGGSNNHNGYLSGTRVVKGSFVYDPSQTSITVPTTPLTNITNTSLLLNFTNAGIYDATSKNDLETVGDAQVSTAINNAFGASTGVMKFDGTGDYLQSVAKDLFAFGTGDYTVETWVYFTSINSTTLQIIFMSGSTGGNNFYAHVDSNQISVGTTAAFVSNQVSSFSTGVWYHIAFCRASGTLRLFKDGVQQGSSVTDSTNWISAGNARCGANESGTQTLFGYLQDLRITKYARYTANFTPPTAAFPTL